MPSRIIYQSVTFREDVWVGATLFTTGMTTSLPVDLAASLGSQVISNGPGTSSTARQPARDPRLFTFSVGGDSFAAHDLQAILPTTAASSFGGVITYRATAHGLGTGDLVNMTGAAQPLANVVRAPVTRIDANTISFPASGCPDGPITTGVAAIQIVAWSQQTGEGLFTHLQRKSRGAFRKVAMAGCSGHKMADYATRYATILEPYPADLHGHWGEFNDLQFGVTVEDSVAAVQETLLKRKNQGSLCFVVSGLPIPNGVYTWPVLIAPLVTLTDATAASWLLRWNRLMRDFCAAQKMLYLDVFAQAVDQTTGYARAGFCKLNDIHPSVKSNRLAIDLLFQQLAASQYTPRLLAASLFDNVSIDSSNRNVCRSAPFATTGGGGASVSGGGTIVSSYTAWVTATVVAAKRWRTNAGHLYYTAAGGTTGATPPTHTVGSASDDTVTWIYIMEATGTAAVPLGWTVATTGSPDAFVAIVPITLADGSPSQAVRIAVVANAASDQVRISYNGTVADVASGDAIDCNANISLNTAMNSANATPLGQNIKSFTTQFVQAYDTNTRTYIAYEARGGVGAANEQQLKDIVSEQCCISQVPIYADGGVMNLWRHDIIMLFTAAGVCSVDVGNLTVMH